MFLTILTGHKRPQISRPREAEPSHLWADDRGFHSRDRV